MISFAVAFENLDSLKFLVEEMKLDVNEISKNHETVLIRACHYNKIEIIKYLLNKGADVEKRSL